MADARVRDHRGLRRLRGDDAPPALQRRDHRRGGFGRVARLRRHPVRPDCGRGFLPHVRVAGTTVTRAALDGGIRTVRIPPRTAACSSTGARKLPSLATSRPPSFMPSVAVGDGPVNRRTRAAPRPVPTPTRSDSAGEPGGLSYESSSFSVCSAPENPAGCEVRRRRRGDRRRQRPVADQRARQQQRVPVGLGMQPALGERSGVGRAQRRVAVAARRVAVEVHARGARRHRLRDVTGRPQRRGERVADARHPAAGDRVRLVDAERYSARRGQSTGTS